MGCLSSRAASTLPPPPGHGAVLSLIGSRPGHLHAHVEKPKGRIKGGKGDLQLNQRERLAWDIAKDRGS